MKPASGVVALILLVGALAPAAAPRSMAAPQQQASGAPYRVQEGDTLYGIALKYGAGLDDLMALNGLEDALDVRTGRTIVIPSPPGQVLAGEHLLCGEFYTVQAGETLADIAFACGLSAAELAHLNGITSPPSLVYPGQVLRLSADAGVRSAGETTTDSPTLAGAPPTESAPTTSAPTTSAPTASALLRPAPTRPPLVPTLAP